MTAPTPIPTVPSAIILLDSINSTGDRLTTMIATMHRFILAELNTHRAFSRNSASSRAIPVSKRTKAVLDDLAMPIEFGRNVRGMQSAGPLDFDATRESQHEWGLASMRAVRSARILDDLGLHKQVANRLLEPFSWHTVLISSTEWDNFFMQRCSPNAQPEMRAVAEAMRDALAASTPIRRETHVPWFDYSYDPHENDFKQSVARCARVSYNNFDGTTDLEADLKLYQHLHAQHHLSPFEHIAFASPNAAATYVDTISGITHRYHPNWGNFKGWSQMRQLVIH